MVVAKDEVCSISFLSLAIVEDLGAIEFWGRGHIFRFLSVVGAVRGAVFEKTPKTGTLRHELKVHNGVTASIVRMRTCNIYTPYPRPIAFPQHTKKSSAAILAGCLAQGIQEHVNRLREAAVNLQLDFKQDEEMRKYSCDRYKDRLTVQFVAEEGL